MNTWGYLILIVALLVLASVMLYARFSMLSREKALHHAPIDLLFPIETISAASLSARETRSSEGIPEEPVPGHGIKLDCLNVVSDPTKEEKKAPEKNRESEYFDELQEAAAGLAMLMRSSPANRVEPVIFAPIEDPSLEGPVVEEPVTDEIEEIEMMVGVDLELPPVAEIEIPLVEVPPTLRAVLGDLVSDKMEKIDEELDALESLVSGIEASLRALEQLDALEEGGEMGDDEGHDLVFEAA